MQFQTIPAEDGALLQKPQTNIRRVIVAAAALSFALGAVAAAATDGGTIIQDGAGGDSIERKGHMDLHGSKTNIENVHITHISSGKCLTANGEDNLELAKCGTGNGKGHHSKQRFNYEYKSGSGRIQYRDGQDYDKVVSVCIWGGWDADTTDCDVILWWDDDDETGENVHWDTSTKQIKAPNSDGKDLCMTKVNSQKVLWKPCGKPYSSDSQKWQIGDAPSPSGGACNKFCPSGKDSECSWFGGANSCTKCDTTPGTRFQCVAP